MQVEYIGSERSNGDQYEVYKGPSRDAAINFLRSKTIKEKRQYIIVETPSGNFGKDLVMIFNEQTQEMIELTKRDFLPTYQKSTTHCTKCGYAILKYGRAFNGNVEELVSLEEMKIKGTGFFCNSCQLSWCASCAQLKNRQVSCEVCESNMGLLRE